MHGRQVMEDDVREWLYKDGGRMPYLETSFGADPVADWRNAEHVFRTVARTAHRMRENFGRHRPPDTVRVAPEADYVDEAPTDGSFGGAVEKLARQSSLVGDAQRLLGSLGRGAAPAALREQLDELGRKASGAAEELLLCGKRSLDHNDCTPGNGHTYVRPTASPIIGAPKYES